MLPRRTKSSAVASKSKPIPIIVAKLSIDTINKPLPPPTDENEDSVNKGKAKLILNVPKCNKLVSARNHELINKTIEADRLKQISCTVPAVNRPKTPLFATGNENLIHSVTAVQTQWKG